MKSNANKGNNSSADSFWSEADCLALGWSNMLIQCCSYLDYLSQILFLFGRINCLLGWPQAVSRSLGQHHVRHFKDSKRNEDSPAASTKITTKVKVRVKVNENVKVKVK